MYLFRWEQIHTLLHIPSMYLFPAEQIHTLLHIPSMYLLRWEQIHTLLHIPSICICSAGNRYIPCYISPLSMYLSRWAIYLQLELNAIFLHLVQQAQLVMFA
jgi:hypothetical protein